MRMRSQVAAGDADAAHAEEVRKKDAAAVAGWLEPRSKGSIGEGSNHSYFSNRNSVRILGIERKPRKTTSSK